ncbi:MAG TPA: AMP-binding protein [Gammaproteobacteria bacterium]|nr:AMP-binding protein [Gammaproteobacteria bacterium]
MPFPFLNGYAADAPVVCHGAQSIDRARFEARVAALRATLPAARHIINLCDNRYAFLTTFAAALAERRVTLLPPDAGDAALLDLCRRYDSVVVVSDRSLPPLPVLVYRWNDVNEPSMSGAGMVPITDDQAAVVVHTSGSTGTPRPHVKSWGALVRRARTVGARLGLAESGIGKIVSTVPSQHMYGIENAIMLPLQHGLPVDGGRPLFPADVAAALDETTLLVTTPIHLRSLTVGGPVGAHPRLILSSTAPLSAEQAREAEEHLGAPVMEIYGSTETGVVATRRTSSTAEWRLLDSLRLRDDERGQMQLHDVETGAVSDLHDSIELRGGDRFVLGARAQDIVKVAGKRTSLAALTESLCAIQGVEDGAFLAPRKQDEAAARLVALVVAPTVSEAEIAAGLRARIDPVFMPRPLVKVESLPRNATGKLPWSALQGFWDRMAG